MKYKIVIFNEYNEHIAIYYSNTLTHAKTLYDNIFIRGDYSISLININDNIIVSSR